MNNSYMHNYIDILNESLGEGYSYYINDNLPIFNIDGLIETYQYDIRNILTESKEAKGKTLIDRIRIIGKKILSFLSGILEKIMGFFKKLRNFIRGKIEQLKNNKKGNKNGDEKIIDGKEYSSRKRNEKNKNNNEDEVDEVDKEKLNIVKSKEDLDKEIEEYNSVEVYRDMDYKGGIAATNKLLDVFQDGFRDYAMEVEKFNNIDSMLRSMGIELNNSEVKRTTDVNDRVRMDKVLVDFRALTKRTDVQICTNGKFNTSDEIKEERDRIKQIFYGSGEKIKISDFKGVVVDNIYEQLKSIDDRIAKIEASTKNVCERAIVNSKAFMNQLEDVSKRIEKTGKENSSLSNIISIFAKEYLQVINKLSSSLRSQVSELRLISITATDAAIDICDIKTVLDNLAVAKRTRKLCESYNDYDSMGWIRDILFE